MKKERPPLEANSLFVFDRADFVYAAFMTSARERRLQENVDAAEDVLGLHISLTKRNHVRVIVLTHFLDDHIVIDQWMIDFCPDRQFYVIPIKE